MDEIIQKSMEKVYEIINWIKEYWVDNRPSLSALPKKLSQGGQNHLKNLGITFLNDIEGTNMQYISCPKDARLKMIYENNKAMLTDLYGFTIMEFYCELNDSTKKLEWEENINPVPWYSNIELFRS